MNTQKVMAITGFLLSFLLPVMPTDAAQQQAPKEIKQRITKRGLKIAAHVRVQYNGSPEFVPIAGTVISYASNTPLHIIHIGQVFYLKTQQVWIAAENPLGPWPPAPSVPAEVPAIICGQLNVNPLDPYELCRVKAD